MTSTANSTNESSFTLYWCKLNGELTFRGHKDADYGEAKDMFEMSLSVERAASQLIAERKDYGGD